MSLLPSATKKNERNTSKKTKKMWIFLAGMLMYRRARKRFGLEEEVQVHHIVPNEFRYHPSVLSSNFKVDASQNLMFVPRGRVNERLHPDRIGNHEGGHSAYNAFVKDLLDAHGADPHSLVPVLKQGVRRGGVPWK